MSNAFFDFVISYKSEETAVFNRLSASLLALSYSYRYFDVIFY